MRWPLPGDAWWRSRDGVRRRLVVPLLLWPVLWLALSTGIRPAPALEQIERSGVLRAAMVNDPTSYYLGPSGYTGFDYDLAQTFAEQLGVELQVVLSSSVDEALDALRRGHVQIAAVAHAVHPQTQLDLRHSRPLRHRRAQLVGRAPRRFSDFDSLDDDILVSDTLEARRWMDQLQARHPGLRWRLRERADTEELLHLVASGEADLALAGSDLVAITRRYYPQLKVLADASEPQPLVWSVARGHGDGLYAALVRHLRLMGATELARVRDRYFGHIDRLGYVDSVTLATHYETRLPRYRDHFERAGRAHGIDWRLLAAVGYQESHWNNAAVSPTGVRGIMQITEQTARFLRISDRMDPEQTIDGAARYLRSLHERLPDSIPEPDRSWFMLACYNIGLGHVLDARRLTAAMDGDPDRWVDVRRHLPLLARPSHYRNLRYGYARGPEAVQYVGNVRTYFDMLVWLSTQESESPVPVTPEARQMRPPRQRDPLAVELPLL